MCQIDKLPLLTAVSKMLGKPATDAEYTSEVLQGGTVGEVCKVSGEAIFDGGGREKFVLVLKTQRKWDRHGDPDCWKREFLIYKNGLADELSPIKLPRCYFLEEGDEENEVNRMWMEYIEGATGNEQLHAAELAQAAEKLGELQADFHLEGRKDLSYIRSYPAVRSSFDLWYGRMKDLLGSQIDGFPDELRHVLNGYAARAEELLETLDTLPLTLCQGDVHHDNLIFKETAEGTDIYLIDWDCAGYGRMGEDAVDVLMEAFVYSGRDVALFSDFRRQIIQSYCRGAANRGMNFNMDSALVRNIAMLAWGFRVADLYLYYKEEFPKKRCVEILWAMLAED